MRSEVHFTGHQEWHAVTVRKLDWCGKNRNSRLRCTRRVHVSVSPRTMSVAIDQRAAPMLSPTTVSANNPPWCRDNSLSHMLFRFHHIRSYGVQPRGRGVPSWWIGVRNYGRHRELVKCRVCTISRHEPIRATLRRHAVFSNWKKRHKWNYIDRTNAIKDCFQCAHCPRLEWEGKDVEATFFGIYVCSSLE